MYNELLAELRMHHCDAKEDDGQEVCEECAYDVIIADKSVPSGIASVCVCGLMNRAADAIEEMQKCIDCIDADNDSLCEQLRKSEVDNINLTGWLAEEHAKHQWIPVEERLPEEGTAVNITWVNHRPAIYYQHIKDKPQTATGVYYRGKWYWWSAVVQDYLAEYGKCEPDEMDAAIEVTHWMRLPEPPKGDA